MTQAPRHISATQQAPSGGPVRSATRLLVPSSDLMLTVQLEAPARAAGIVLEALATPHELEAALTRETPGLALLDMADAAFPFTETYALIKQAAAGTRCIAIYPHVRAELGELAKAAGCDVVLPRSRFFMAVAEALESAMAAPASRPAPTGDSR